MVNAPETTKARRSAVPLLSFSSKDELSVLRKVLDITTLDADLDRVLQEIVKIMAETAKVDSVFIYLFDHSKAFLVLRASKSGHREDLGRVMLKVNEGLTGWAAKSGQTVVIEKNAYDDPRFKAIDSLPEDRYEAFMALPIIFKGNMIGVINFQHKKPHIFPDNVVALLTLVSSQIGGVIEHARLYDETHAKAIQFDTLAKVSETIVSEKYLDEILNLIVVVTAEMLNSKICSIMLLDARGVDLVIRATQSLSDAYRNKPHLKIDASLMGEVVKTRKCLVVEDVCREKRYCYRDMAIKEGLSSMLAVPMIVKEKAVGVLCVYTKKPHRFTRDEVDVIQIVANQAAVAVENTKLMEESLKAAEALETRKVVDRAKAALMRMQGMDEEVAYRIIHRKSMDTSRTMKEIAEAIILMESFHKIT